LNPRGCGLACREIRREAGCRDVRIGVVAGDDVLDAIRGATEGSGAAGPFQNLETHEPLAKVRSAVVTANAYLGAGPIAEALTRGAQIVITGRVADPSLTVAPCAHHYGWSMDDHDRIAGATVAGHLIECGTQVTGGISTDWLSLPDPAHIGYPVAEVGADGSCVITKPAGTGGRVSTETVKEQLLYEIGDPDGFRTPDVTASFRSLQVEGQGPDRVRVRGATGRPPPPTYKVSATYRDGFTAQGTLTIFGRDAVAKARRAGEIVLERVRGAGYELERTCIECLGTGGATAGVGVSSARRGEMETVLRIAVADPRREAVERFVMEMAPLITSGPQGVTGYSAGRPRVRPVFGYWPCLIDRQAVRPEVQILET
jgi:hypothetical protein